MFVEVHEMEFDHKVAHVYTDKDTFAIYVICSIDDLELMQIGLIANYRCLICEDVDMSGLHAKGLLLVQQAELRLDFL